MQFGFYLRQAVDGDVTSNKKINVRFHICFSENVSQDDQVKVPRSLEYVPSRVQRKFSESESLFPLFFFLSSRRGTGTTSNSLLASRRDKFH